MSEKGVEPSREAHMNLNHARLPISPLRHILKLIAMLGCSKGFIL